MFSNTELVLHLLVRIGASALSKSVDHMNDMGENWDTTFLSHSFRFMWTSFDPQNFKQPANCFLNLFA